MTFDSYEMSVEVKSRPERTLVLLGKTGNGKSATGNSILGETKFLSDQSGAAVTKECQLLSVKLPNSQKINVIDSPGLFSSSMTPDFTIKEIVRCLLLAKNGIDAVLLVFSVLNRLTDEERSTLKKLKTLFGDQIVNHMIVVFTNGDDLEENGETLDDYLADSSEFQEIIQECNGRKVLFDNSPDIDQDKKIKQVQELLDLVEEIAKQNDGKPYMSDLSLEIREKNVIYEENQKRIESMKGWSSNKEIAEVRKEVEKSYKEMLKGIEEKITTQMKESLKEMTDQLAKAKAERDEIKKKLTAAKKVSSDDIRKLREQLNEAEKKTASLRKEVDGTCSVL